jgi:hypothetical protein
LIFSGIGEPERQQPKTRKPPSRHGGLFGDGKDSENAVSNTSTAPSTCHGLAGFLAAFFVSSSLPLCIGFVFLADGFVELDQPLQVLDATSPEA